jgi:hypothetical protein
MSFFAPFSSFRMSTKQSCSCDKLNLDDIRPIETSNKFEIVVILDESGSMENIRNNMLDSLNDLIKEQKQITGRPATFSLIKFNQDINANKENIPLEDMNLLTPEDYHPNGSTALYDAIGYAINRFRNERDVLMVIITDGQENASKKFNKQYVSSKLDEKQKYNNWSYVYLSCDLNTFQQGQSMGLNTSAHCSNIKRSVNDYGDYLCKNVSQAMSNYRTKGISVNSQLNSQLNSQ